jgi:hypothetical protein
MGIAVDNEQAVARRRYDHVGIRQNVLAPGAGALAGPVVGDDTRRRRIHQRVEAQQNVHISGSVDSDIGDAPRTRRQIAERPFHPITLRAERHDQFGFHRRSPLRPLAPVRWLRRRRKSGATARYLLA